jgi:hypothetical protein
MHLMKTAALVLALLAPSVALAQAPAKPSASITAKAMAARTGRVNNYITDYGSYDKTYQREVTVEAQISTSGRASFPAVLHWFIVVKPVKSPKRILVEAGEIPVNVAPGGSTKTEFTSKPVKSTDTNFAYAGDRYMSGAKIDGWVLRLVSMDGQELATTTNAPEAMAWLKTQPEWLTGKVKPPEIGAPGFRPAP